MTGMDGSVMSTRCRGDGKRLVRLDTVAGELDRLHRGSYVGQSMRRATWHPCRVPSRRRPQSHAMHDYPKKILSARVYDVAIETPLDAMPRMSDRLGVKVLLKREDLQPVFSFKIRGAYNKIVNLPPEVRARGIVTASAGNHAQGVALAAKRLGVSHAFLQRRMTLLVSQKAKAICTPDREDAGAAPLPSGHPISWNAIALPSHA